MWIQPGVLALDTAIGLVIKIQPGVLILDTAIGSGSGYNKGSSQCCGYIQRFSTPDTARASVLWIQPGVLALDPTMDSGFINLGSIS
jgi:hypothetical protein